MRDKSNIFFINFFWIFCGLLFVFLGCLVIFDKSFTQQIFNLLSLFKGKSPNEIINGVPLIVYWQEKLGKIAIIILLTGILIIFYYAISGILNKKNQLFLLNDFKKINNILINNLCFMALAIVIFLTIFLGSLTWPVADDFSIYAHVQEKGILGTVIYYFKFQEGRFFTIFLDSLLFKFFKFQYSYFITIFYAIILISSSILTTRIILLINNFKRNSKVIFSFYFFTILIGLAPIIKEVVYWITGGAYILSFFLVILYFYLLFLLNFSDNNKRNKIIIISFLMLFSIFFGGMVQNLSPVILFNLLIFLIYLIKIKSKNWFYILIFLILILIGTAIMYLAPGNYIRAGFGNNIDFSFSAIISNYFKVLLTYLRQSLVMVALSIIGSACFSIYFVLNKNNQSFFLNENNKINKRLKIVITFLFLISALISILPFALIPDFAAPRAGLFFMMLISIFIWQIGLILFVPFLNKMIARFKNFHIVIAIVPIIFIFITFSFIVSMTTRSIYDAIIIGDQIKNRHSYLINLDDSARDSIIIIDKVSGRLPELIYFEDITNNPDHWRNKDFAKFFKIKSVIIKD